MAATCYMAQLQGSNHLGMHLCKAVWVMLVPEAVRMMMQVAMTEGGGHIDKGSRVMWWQ